MMRRRWAFLVIGCLPIAGAVHAADLPDLVRSLNILQNRMATGDVVAREQAPAQFDAIDRAIAGVGPQAWREERNVRAAIIYLLAGGAPANLRALLKAKLASPEMTPLLSAALDYAEGRNSGVADAIMSFDPRNYPPILGGHIALVQAGLLTRADMSRALALFDLARLLMPGSLVEEAALRRQIELVEPSRDREKLALLCARYVSIYAASPFSQSFWRSFRRLYAMAPEAFRNSDTFAKIIDKAPAREQTEFALTLCRNALLAGDLVDARRRLDRAEASAAEGAERARIAAFRAALAALFDETGKSAESGGHFQDVAPADRAALSIARSVAARIAQPSRSTVAMPRAADDKGDESELYTGVRDALSQTDTLLARAAHR